MHQEVNSERRADLEVLLVQKDKMEQLLEDTKGLMAKADGNEAIRAVYQTAVTKCEEDLRGICDKIKALNRGRRVSVLSGKGSLTKEDLEKFKKPDGDW